VLDRGYAVRDPSGKPRRVIGAMMDITDRKEAERMKSDFGRSSARSSRLMTRATRVLLVEDDRFLPRACEASLRQRGFQVTTASEGDEGRLAQTEPYPDIVLLDLLMPKLPGIEVLRALRGESGYRADSRADPVELLARRSQTQAEQLRASGYFVKANLSLKDLGAHVDKLLATHG
jgi:CheY-like chemotaxis protein